MLNMVIIGGRFTSDPELKTTQTGVSTCSFRLASNKKYKDSEKVLFLNCVAWRGTAETIARCFRKGKEIVIIGELETRSWQDKEGKNHSLIECQVNSFEFCGPKDAQEAPAEVPTYAPNAAQYEDLSDDGELPF